MNTIFDRPPISLPRVTLALVATALLILSPALAPRASAQTVAAKATEFPPELVRWTPFPGNPIFNAAGPGHWDVKIRERGWILREGDVYRLWFTGYDGTRDGIRQLGYATSPDGIHWISSPANPLCREHWIEDMCIVKEGDTYFMFAEGPDHNHAEMLTSHDGVDWKWEGPLDVRLADGERAAEKPCGTPTVWVENGTWYLFYEWRDLGVWLATSKDPQTQVWTNVRDTPVLAMGPTECDSQQIAVDQIIKYRGKYFAFYHGSGGGDSSGRRTWDTNIARSDDLVHWEKYPGNPIIDDNKSSGIVVPDGNGFRLYTMHGQIDLFLSREK